MIYTYELQTFAFDQNHAHFLSIQKKCNMNLYIVHVIIILFSN